MSPPPRISEGPVAPWRQILAILRARIADGTYPPGGRIPAVIDLAHEFGVAITTVRKAIEVMKEDGEIETSPMGTYVAEKRRRR